MGCGSSKVLAGYTPQSSKNLHSPDAKLTNDEEDGREWKVFNTDIDLMFKYTADGTMKPSSSKEHLELRTLLDESTAVEAIMSYAQSVNSADCLRLWLAIQEVKRDDSGFDMVRQHAERVYSVFLADSVASKLEFLEPEWINAVKDALSTDSPAFDASVSSRDRLRSASFVVSAGMNAYVDIFNLNPIQRECFLVLFVEVFVKFKQCTEYRQLVSVLKKKYNYCQPDDFQFFNKLGEGSFGVVVHVRKKTTGAHYAMKIQTKIALLNKCLEDPGKVDYEKQALMACSHPFIARMDYAFETSSLAIIVMEYCNGIDMAMILRQVKDGRLPEKTVCFIAAEIVCALEYMHGMGLLYRDLKPGNVLLNKDGHIQLIDLGTVGDLQGECLQAVDPTTSGLIAQHGSASHAHGTPSEMADDEDGDDFFLITAPKRAMSVVGTMAFMAPEVKVMMNQLEGERQGYSNGVDYWSLGATIYNLVVGVQPFAGNKHTNRTIKSLDEREVSPKKRVSRYEMSYPNYLSDDIRNLIGRFLDVNPASRLVSVDEIKSHPFFQDINWERLETKKVLPPYIPKQEVSSKIPEHENFAELMDVLGIEDWLDCAPPPALDKYFNEWKYVSENVISLEKELQVTSRRLRGAKKHGSKTSSASHASGSQSGSPNNSIHSVESGQRSQYSAYSIPLPAANTSNLMSLKSSDAFVSSPIVHPQSLIS